MNGVMSQIKDNHAHLFIDSSKKRKEAIIYKMHLLHLNDIKKQP